MASSKEYLEFVREQLSDLEGVSYRAMMGEYILYYEGKVIGGIYDNRLLLKPTKSVVSIFPEAPRELPYPGAKAMPAAEVDNRALLQRAVEAVAADLPAKKKA